MAFARTTAVAGEGTVSCAGTTTVTGTGTSFAFGFGGIPTGAQARVGGTITVGANTRTIVAIASANSLTVDTAFPTFTTQAFTVQTGIIQTGTDTMNLSLGVAAGFTITNRGDLFRTFDCQGNDLTINGTLTVSSSVAQLRNDGSCNNRLTVNGSVSGGELIFNGRIASAGNGPYPYAGLDWLGTNGMGGATALNSTNATYPAKLTLIDACVRFGADWFTVSSGNFARITTQGDECWILCAKGTGTVQGRIRLNNNTPVLDFQAKQTWASTWLNFGSSQVSLKGFTPIFTDGPEINVDTISVVSRIPIEDYNTSYIQAAYYVGSQLVMYGGGWIRLKNNLLGSNLTWRGVNAAVGRYNIVELSKQIKVISKDAVGNVLNDGYFYFQPVGSNVSGIRPKGVTTDVTFDLTQKNILVSGGFAETEFVYAWDYSLQTVNESTYDYFCLGTTKGAETHPAFLSRYGYDKQPITMALSGNGTYEATVVHASLPTSDKIIANAASITGVSVNFEIKNITITGTPTIQEIYDVYQYQLNQTVNLNYVNECVINGKETRYIGWNIVVYPSANIQTSTAFNLIYADIITIVDSSTMSYMFNAAGILQANGVLLPNDIFGVQGTWTGSGLITGIYQDMTGARALVKNLDPQSFGVTWNLRYKKVSDSTWTTTFGTGNNTTILVDTAFEYNVQVRVAGYAWKSISFNPAIVLEVDMALAYHVASDGTPQYEKSFISSLVDIFEYNDTELSVEVTNTTGSILQIGFDEMYQVIEKIQQKPALVWSWVNPVTTNSTSQKVLIPQTNPLKMFLSNGSNSSVKITCPVAYSETGISADDKVKGNPSGYSIILGSSATADSSLIVSQLVEQLGGIGYDTDNHSLTKIKIKVDKSLTKTQFLSFD